MDIIEEKIGKDVCGIIKDYLRRRIICCIIASTAYIFPWGGRSETLTVAYLDNINSECVKRRYLTSEEIPHCLDSDEIIMGNNKYKICSVAYDAFLYNITKNYLIYILYSKIHSIKYGAHPDVIKFIKDPEYENSCFPSCIKTLEFDQDLVHWDMGHQFLIRS